MTNLPNPQIRQWILLWNSISRFWNSCNFCDWYKILASSVSSPKVFCLLSFSWSKQGHWQKSALNCPITQPPEPLSYLKGNRISHEIMMTSCLKKTVQTEVSFVFIYELWQRPQMALYVCVCVAGGRGNSLLKKMGNYRNPWEKGFKNDPLFPHSNLLLTCKYSSFQSVFMQYHRLL